MSKEIIRKLIQNEICFSIGVSHQKLKNKGVDRVSNDYFAILSDKDQETAKENLFKRETGRDYYTRDLSQCCVKFFKKNTEKFKLIMTGSEGRIYELKERSFKQYHEDLTNYQL